MDELNKMFEAINTYGPVVVIIGCLLFMNLVFIIRDWKREIRQENRLVAMQDRLIPLVEECKEAICTGAISNTNAANVIEANNRLLEKHFGDNGESKVS